MDIKQLKAFLIETKKGGYGAGNDNVWVKEKDGSTTINFKSGDFRMHDNFFGGEPFGGRVIVFYKEKPVWIMVMYGWIEPSVNDFKTVYKFLQKSLLKQPEDLPLRGPKLFKEEEFVYKNKTKGNLENFKGEEVILKNKKQIYKTYFFGGLVEVRKE
jgi:hypothetical protein